jgi:flagellin
VGLRVNTNLEAFNAHRSLMLNSARLAKSMERLSSGYRINRAADDAAGLGISERMRSQISGIAQASRNAQDGISLVQTAEGSMQEIHSILHRIRDLAVQYNNGVYDANGRAAITAEVAQLSSELGRMISSSSFAGTPLLNGGVLATLQVGPNNGDTIIVTGVDALASIGTEVERFASADATVTLIDLQQIDDAINALAQDRAMMGGVQNRLEYTVSSLGVYEENLMAAESRIRDVDMAKEMTELTRLQILQQSGTAMLAQANMLHSSVLSLLQ